MKYAENEKNDNFAFDKKYPYKCKVIDGGLEFIPTIIDYDLRQIYHQIGQTSDSGEWFDFDEVIFKANKKFSGINLS